MSALWVSATENVLRLGRPARAVLSVILLAGAVRLVLAGAVGLGVDESYTVVIARRFNLSYFDHPPLVFWLVGNVARLVGEHPIALRLPFILLFGGTTWLAYRLGARLFGDWEGAYGAVALNLSAVFTVSTASWILPDGPLMFFLLASAYCLVRALFDAGPGARTGWWCAAGVAMGLAGLSKYQAIFLPLGTLAFLCRAPPQRRWLGRAGPYVALAIATCLCLPVLIWNAQHRWISFRFQLGRGVPSAGVHPAAVLFSLAGQAVYLLPWMWLPLVWLLVTGLAKGPRDPKRWLLCCLAVGPIASLTLVALGGKPGLPHWTAPGYLFLFPLLGVATRPRMADRDVGVRVWGVGSAAAVVVLVFVFTSHTATGWLGRVVPGLLRRGDPTMEMLDWRELGPMLATRGLLDPDRFVLAANWIDGGKLGYALGPKVTVACLSSNAHHFRYLYDPTVLLGRDAVLIVRAQNAATVAREYARFFLAIDSVATVPIHRAERTDLELTLYLARHFSTVPLRADVAAPDDRGPVEDEEGTTSEPR